MDITKLKKYVSKVVEQEVKRQVAAAKAQILDEVAKGVAGVLLEERKKQKYSPVSKPAGIVEQKQKPVYRQRQNQNKRYVSDPVLNEILAGAGTIPPEGPPGVYMGALDYQDSTGTDFEIQSSYEDVRSVQAAPMMDMSVDLDGRPVNTKNEAVQDVLSFMNMDYSGVLKKMEESSKNFRSGL
jgi:hypothetical protein